MTEEDQATATTVCSEIGKGNPCRCSFASTSKCTQEPEGLQERVGVDSCSCPLFPQLPLVPSGTSTERGMRAPDNTTAVSFSTHKGEAFVFSSPKRDDNMYSIE